MDLKDVFILLLGWLFGMLSPSIVKQIEKKYTKKELHKGICSELNELRYILIHSCSVVGEKAGKFDKEFLDWFLQLSQFYQNRPLDSSVIPVLKKLIDSKNAEEDIATYVKIGRANSTTGLSLKKIAITFTDLNVGEIAVFKVPYQILLFDLRRQIDAYNDEVVKAENLHAMTFDSSLTTANHGIIVKSVHEKYGHIQTMGIKLVDTITKLLEFKKY
jgi:hypothetical protein